MVLVPAMTTMDNSPNANGDGDDGMPASPGYIDGFSVTRVDATHVSVNPGAAYIPGPATIGVMPSAVTLNIPNNSTVYYIYAYYQGTSLTVEASTTAPASYFGQAQAKQGDTTRRLVGVVVTGAAGVILFYQAGPEYYYATPQRILAAGTATGSTVVSGAAVLPLNTAAAYYQAINTGNQSLNLGNDLAPTIVSVNATDREFLWLSASARYIRYNYAAAVSSGGASIDVIGFKFSR